MRISDGIGIREATVADCAAVADVHARSRRGSFAGVAPHSFLDKMSVERRAEAFAGRFKEDAYRMFVAEAARRVVGSKQVGIEGVTFGEFVYGWNNLSEGGVSRDA